MLKQLLLLSALAAAVWANPLPPERPGPGDVPLEVAGILTEDQWKTLDAAQRGFVLKFLRDPWTREPFAYNHKGISYMSWEDVPKDAQGPVLLELVKAAPPIPPQAIYRGAHPSLREQSEALKALKGAAVPGGDKQALDRAFDKAPPGGDSGTVVVTGKPGVALKPRPAPVPQIRWTFVDDPKDPSDPVEKDLVRAALSGLDSPIEREILASVRKQQNEIGAYYAGQIKRADETLAQLKKDIDSGTWRGVDLENLKRNQKEWQDFRKQFTAFSPVVNIRVLKMEENKGGEMGLEEGLGPDGKRHFFIRLNRKFVMAPVVQNPRDGIRKIMAHELVHLSDAFAAMTRNGPTERFIEARAYRVSAQSYLEEGLPQGDIPRMFGGNVLDLIRQDPLDWFLNTLEDKRGMKLKAMWEIRSADDLADPFRALAWRSDYTVESVLKTPARMAEAEAALPAEIVAILKKVIEDPELPAHLKRPTFTNRVTTSKWGQSWMKTVKGDAAALKKVKGEEVALFKSLEALFK